LQRQPHFGIFSGPRFGGQARWLALVLLDPVQESAQVEQPDASLQDSERLAPRRGVDSSSSDRIRRATANYGGHFASERGTVVIGVDPIASRWPLLQRRCQLG
jgi:hypothetical protein